VTIVAAEGETTLKKQKVDANFKMDPYADIHISADPGRRKGESARE
jgi:hypothetical protein